MIVLGIDFGTTSFYGCIFNTESNSKKFVSIKNTSYKKSGLKKDLDPDLVIKDFLYFLDVFGKSCDLKAVDAVSVCPVPD